MKYFIQSVIFKITNLMEMIVSVMIVAAVFILIGKMSMSLNSLVSIDNADDCGASDTTGNFDQYSWTSTSLRK